MIQHNIHILLKLHHHRLCLHNIKLHITVFNNKLHLKNLIYINYEVITTTFAVCTLSPVIASLGKMTPQIYLLLLNTFNYYIESLN